MKKLKSRRGIPLPVLFFITDKSQVLDIPKGIPYFLGQEGTEDDIVTILEYEVLLQRARKTGYPFNFERLLEKEGFKSMDKSKISEKVFTNIHNPKSNKNYKLSSGTYYLKNFLKKSSVFVDIQIIKDLKIFPVWMVDDVEAAISVNLNNYAMYDSNMYNKKLDGVYGGISLKAPTKNLIIIDISSSIPKSISKTCLLLAKNMSESFYADIMITGSTTTLYPYEKISELDVNTIYEENGMHNDQVNYVNLLKEMERHYDTLIVFGDEDSPEWAWHNKYNYGSKNISIDEGKKINKWKVNNLINFHTAESYYRSNYDYAPLAGYGRFFDVDEENIKNVRDWVIDIE